MTDDKAKLELGQGDGAATDEPGPTVELGILTDPVDALDCVACGAEIDTREIPSFATIICPACQAELVVPARLGNFRLLNVLGAGGMGAVFLAQDDTLQRQVAIKVLLRSIGEDAAVLESFRREAQAIARLNHPHIVQIYSFGEAKGQPYLVMELVTGDKLDDLIESGSPLDPAFVMRVGLEVAEGLAAAQNANLLHGDIKPENVLIDGQMQAKLVDFGIARALSTKESGEEVWGTPFYIAPEKARRQRVDVRSDIYSLGATLYHAIAGVPPFDGEDVEAVIRARFEEPPTPLAELRPGIEPQVVQIVGRMMHNDLFLRYPNYLSLIKDMRRYLDSVPEQRKVLPAGLRRKLRKGTSQLSGGTQIAGASGRLLRPSQRVSGALSAPPNGVNGMATGRRKSLVVQKGSVSTSAPVKSGPVAPRDSVGAEGDRPGLSPKVWIGLMLFVVAAVLLAAVGLVATLFLRQQRAERERQGWYVSAREADQSLPAVDARAARAVAVLETRDADAGELLVQAGDLLRRAAGVEWVVPELDPVDPPEASAAEHEPPSGTPPPEQPALVRSAERLIEPAQAIRALLREAEAVRQRPLPAAEELQPERMTEALWRQRQARLERREADVERIEGRIRKADEHLLQMRRTLAELEREAAGRLAELRQQEEQARRDRDAAEQEAARQRVEQARQRRVQRDLAQIEALVQQRQELVRAYAYGRVAREIERAKNELATESGRDALAVEVERFQRLDSLKQFVLADLKAHQGVRWGLIQADVLGADVEAEELILAGGRRLPLEEVTIAQWLNLITLLLENRPPDRSLGVIEQGEQLFNAAIFCIVHGGGSETARARAEALARAAVSRRTALELDVPRILPQVRLGGG